MPIFFGLLSLFGYGLSDAMLAVPSKQLSGPVTILYKGIFVLTILGILALLITENRHITMAALTLQLGIILLGYLAFLAFIKSLRVGKVGVVVPIANASTVFTTLFSIVFLGEKLNWIQLVAIALICTGIVLVSINFRDWKSSPIFSFSSGVPYAMLCCLAWGVLFTLSKFTVAAFGPVLNSLLLESGMFACAAIHLGLTQTRLPHATRQLWLQILGVAITGTAGTLFLYAGLNLGSVAVVTALSFSGPLIATLYGKFVYHEQLRLRQYLAIAGMAGGILLISAVRV